MKAAVYEVFRQALRIQNVPDPVPGEDAVVVRVKACGICRSDWHGWMGHDPDVRVPHVPGHELAGVVEEVGKNVSRWRKGDSVTVPFVCGCGKCPQCASGNHQVCDHQSQPGFTHWGAFAEYVVIQRADINPVTAPGNRLCNRGGSWLPVYDLFQSHCGARPCFAGAVGGHPRVRRCGAIGCHDSQRYGRPGDWCGHQ